MSNQFRYPGAQPFSSKEQHLFFGRTKDVEALKGKISLQQLVVLYGKSGLGKSSLLHAGLLPQIESELHLHPLYFRFGAFTAENNLSPLAKTRRLIGGSSDLLNRLYPEEEKSLWYLLKSRQLKEGAGCLLVFDQFEELFTYPEAKIREFVRQLGEALSTTIPDRFREQLKLHLAGEKDKLEEVELEQLHTPLAVKVLIIIRSDRLGLLNKWKVYLPQVLDNLFELKPLNPLQAKDAIEKPALVEGAFATPKFTFEKGAVDLLIDFLSDEDTASIESFQLQLLCSYLEQSVIKAEGREKISADDLKNPSEILENYYNNKINEIPDEKDRQAARRLIEDGLIFEEEERRIGLYEGKIRRDFKISSELLQRLLDTHLIRSEPSARGGYIYELSHDTLVTPVLKARAKRLADEQQKKEEEALLEKQRELDRERWKRGRANGLALSGFILAAITTIATIWALKAQYLARQSAEASQNLAATFKAMELDPTQAMQMAAANQKKNPDNPSVNWAFHKIFSDSKSWFYQSTWKGHDHDLTCAVFSPDGEQILTSGYDGTVKLWSTKGKHLKTLPKQEEPVHSAVFSKNNELILTVGAEGIAKIWNAEGTLLDSLLNRSTELNSAVFSPDDQQILTAGEDGTIQVWTKDGKQLHSWKAHQRRVLSAVFSPNGQYILTTGNGVAKIWTKDGRKLLDSLQEQKGGIRSAVFSPNSLSILTGSVDGIATIWTLNGDVKTSWKAHDGLILSTRFSAEGDRLLTAGADGVAKLWTIEGQILAFLRGHAGWVQAAEFSPDKEHILTGGEDGTIKIWSKANKIPLSLRKHTGSVNAAGFSKNGKHLITAGADSTIKVWTAEGELQHSWKGHKGRIYTVEFSPDDQYVLSAGEDHTAKVWTLNGRNSVTLKRHKGPVFSAVFSPNGDRILSASADSTAILWTAGGKFIASLKGHEGEVNHAVFSPDGRLILTASDDHTAKVWNTNGKVIAILKGHKDWVQSAVFSPKGDTIITASDDGTAKIWRTDGKLIATLKGHKSVVLTAVFDHQGKHVLTAGADGSVKIWDKKGNPIATLTEHEGPVNSAVFSPDDQSILSAGSDGTAKIWLTPVSLENTAIAPLDTVWAVQQGYQFPWQELKNIHSSGWQALADYFFEERDWKKAPFFYHQLLSRKQTVGNQLKLYEIAENSSYPFKFDRLNQFTSAEELNQLATFFYNEKNWSQAAVFYKKWLAVQDTSAARYGWYQVGLKQKKNLFDELFLVKDTSQLIAFTEELWGAFHDTLFLKMEKQLLQLSPSAENRRRVGDRYNDLVWDNLLHKKWAVADHYLQQGLKIDPGNNLLNSNKGHLILFQNRFEEAKIFYLQWKDKPFGEGNGRTFNDVFLDDFKTFKERNLRHPDLEKIEALLLDNSS